MTTNLSSASNQRVGMACAVFAQLLWGVFPIYVHVLKNKVDSLHFVAHRAIWAFLTLLGLMLIAQLAERVRVTWLPSLAEIRSALQDRATIKRFLLAAFFLLLNWLGFVWAISNDHALDASLGYYICPQVAILLGVIFLGERLTPIQWVAVGLTIIGVGVVVFSKAGMPAISLFLAISFGYYGLVKKKTLISPLVGLTFETGILFVPAFIYLGFLSFTSRSLPFTAVGWMNGMLLASGAVTIAPLALYAAALKRIRLTTAGILQFVGPTIQFFIGAFLFGEELDRARLIAFGFVWSGVALYLMTLRPPENEIDT